MNLYLIRHTAPDIPRGICYGQTDVGTLPSFEQEKEKIREELSRCPANHIITSPLARCVKLARALQQPGMGLESDDRLMELHFGDWEGKTWDEIGRSTEAKRWFDDYINHACPGGEAFVHLIRRVKAFSLDIQARYPGNHLWIVCHGGTIRAMHTILNGMPPRDTFQLAIPYGKIEKFVCGNSKA